MSVNQNRNAAPADDFLVMRDQCEPANDCRRDDELIGGIGCWQTPVGEFAGFGGYFRCDRENGDVCFQGRLHPIQGREIQFQCLVFDRLGNFPEGNIQQEQWRFRFGEKFCGGLEPAPDNQPFPGVGVEQMAHRMAFQ